MRKIPAAVLMLFAVAGMLTSAGDGGSVEYKGPMSLGPYHIDRGLSRQEVVKQVGQPATKTSPFCFQLRDHRGYVRLEQGHLSEGVDAVVLNEFPNCVNRAIGETQTASAGWRTPEGIGLGSSEEEVRKAYGKPSGEWAVNPGVRRWVVYNNAYTGRPGESLPYVGEMLLLYRATPEDSLFVAQFGICKKKVCWIEISNRE